MRIFKVLASSICTSADPAEPFVVTYFTPGSIYATMTPKQLQIEALATMSECAEVITFKSTAGIYWGPAETSYPVPDLPNEGKMCECSDGVKLSKETISSPLQCPDAKVFGSALLRLTFRDGADRRKRIAYVNSTSGVFTRAQLGLAISKLHMRITDHNCKSIDAATLPMGEFCLYPTETYHPYQRLLALVYHGPVNGYKLMTADG